MTAKNTINFNGCDNIVLTDLAVEESNDNTINLPVDNCEYDFRISFEDGSKRNKITAISIFQSGKKQLKVGDTIGTISINGGLVGFLERKIDYTETDITAIKNIIDLTGRKYFTATHNNEYRTNGVACFVPESKSGTLLKIMKSNGETVGYQLRLNYKEN